MKKERLTIENRMLIEQLLKLNYDLKSMLRQLTLLPLLFLEKLKKEEYVVKTYFPNVIS